MFSHVRKFLLKTTLCACAGFMALSASAFVMEIDLPDPSLPFWVDYDGTAQYGRWNVIPVTITPTINDPAMTVTPGDKGNSSSMVMPVGDFEEGVHYEIWPGEPIQLPGNSTTPIKGRFYLRVTQATGIGTTLTIRTQASGPRSTLTMNVEADYGAEMRNAVVLTGTPNPISVWMSGLSLDVEGAPPGPQTATLTLTNQNPEFGTITTPVTATHPYGATTEMTAAPAVVRAEDNPAPLYGNVYFEITVTPNATTPNGSIMTLEATRIDIAEASYLGNGTITGTVTFVDRILSFSTNEKHVNEGDVANIGFSMTKGFPTNSGLSFYQDMASDRPAAPNDNGGAPHPDYIGASAAGGNLIYHVLEGGTQLDSVPLNALQDAGTLRVVTTDNRWFDLYRILRITPAADSVATYQVNPYCDLYIHEKGVWPITSFKYKEIVVPPGTETVNVPVIVDKTSEADYLPELIIRSRGGNSNWTKMQAIKFTSGIQEVSALMGIRNYKGEDVSITYILSNPTNCTIGIQNTCKVTVLGEPSVASLAKTQTHYNVTEGKDVVIKVKMDKSRSYDVLLPIYVDTPDAQYTPLATEGFDYVLPPQLVIPAGSTTGSIRVRIPVTYDVSSDEFRHFSFRFGDFADTTIGSWAADEAPVITVHVKQKRVKDMPDVWLPASQLNVEVERPFMIHAGSTNDLHIFAAALPNGATVKIGTENQPGVFDWNPLGTGAIPANPNQPLYLKVSNGINRGDNFVLPLKFRSGRTTKTIKLMVADRRPKVYPQYHTRIAPANPMTFYPLQNSEKTERLMGDPELAQKMVYIKYDEGYVAFQPSTEGSVLNFTLNAPGTHSVSTSGLYTEVDQWGIVTFLSTAVSPTNITSINNEVSADTIYLLFGHESLRRPNGFAAALNDTVLSSRTLSAWGTYIDPYAPYKKAGLTRKIKFRATTDEFHNRLVRCPSNIRLYDKRELKRAAQEGRYSDGIEQVETVAVSVGVKTDTAKYETDKKFFIYAPVVDGIQMWGNTKNIPVRTYFDSATLVLEGAAPLHAGSIIKITGRYFGDKPKVWLECYRDGAASLLKANCKVMTIRPTQHVDSGQYVMYVRMPTKLSASWHYDDPDMYDFALSRTRLIINSGAGLTGIQVAVRPFTQVSQSDNAYPTAIERNDPIYYGNYNQDRTLDIPITLMTFDKSNYAGFLANDANGDELEVFDVRTQVTGQLEGSVSIIRNEMGGQSIRFKPKASHRVGETTISFKVREKHGKGLGLQTEGYFRIRYD